MFLADEKYIAERCAGFTLPARLAEQLAKWQDDQQHNLDPDHREVDPSSAEILGED